mmetsp:Transcript_24853/g.52042  ORF Transcript_24853/g.52042 Transcript_24853/m.52042 type:complete len:99 (-) Transcript_24853:55-351(-)
MLACCWKNSYGATDSVMEQQRLRPSAWVPWCLEYRRVWKRLQASRTIKKYFRVTVDGGRWQRREVVRVVGTMMVEVCLCLLLPSNDMIIDGGFGVCVW